MNPEGENLLVGLLEQPRTVRKNPWLKSVNMALYGFADDFLTFFINLQSKKYDEKLAEFLLWTRIMTFLKPFNP